MGLGKTVELMALILGNPLKDLNIDSDDSVVDGNVDMDSMEVDVDAGKEITGDLAGDSSEAVQQASLSDGDSSGSEETAGNAGITAIANKGIQLDTSASVRTSKRQLPKPFQNLINKGITENTGKKAAKIITDTKSTLIVVPSTLLGQWWRELHNRVNRRDTNKMSGDNNSIKSFNILNISDIDFKNFYVPYKVYYMNIYIYV
jgi:hypothetical protein